jgi:hypothetical protein
MSKDNGFFVLKSIISNESFKPGKTIFIHIFPNKIKFPKGL